MSRASTTIDNKLAAQKNRPHVLQSLIEKDLLLAEAIQDPKRLKQVRHAALQFYAAQLRSPNKKLAQAMREVNPRAFLGSVLDAVNDGLMPNGIDGWIVPRGSGCIWTRSWRGLVRMIRASMESRGASALSIVAEVVRERDRFSCDLASRRLGPHEPMLAEDAGRIIAAYASIEWTDAKGSTHRAWRLVPWTELDRRAKRSGSPYDDAWSQVWSEWTESMSRKTAIRALADWLDLDDVTSAAVLCDDEGGAPADNEHDDQPDDMGAAVVVQVDQDAVRGADDAIG